MATGSPLVDGRRARPVRARDSTCSARSPPCATATTTIAELHREIADGRHGAASIASRGVDAPAVERRAEPVRRRHRRHVGDLPRRGRRCATFWENTLEGVDAITEIPPDRWDWRLYYDADPKAPDKIVSKWGGFVPDVAVRPAPLRDAAVEPAVDRAGATAGPGGGRGRRSTTPATPTGRSPASGRPSSSAWAAARPSWRWAMPSARTCRCSTP